MKRSGRSEARSNGDGGKRKGGRRKRWRRWKKLISSHRWCPHIEGLLYLCTDPTCPSTFHLPPYIIASPLPVLPSCPPTSPLPSYLTPPCLCTSLPLLLLPFLPPVYFPAHLPFPYLPTFPSPFLLLSLPPYISF